MNLEQCFSTFFLPRGTFGQHYHYLSTPLDAKELLMSIEVITSGTPVENHCFRMNAHLAEILARKIFTVVDASIIPDEFLFRHLLLDLKIMN